MSPPSPLPTSRCGQLSACILFFVAVSGPGVLVAAAGPQDSTARPANSSALAVFVDCSTCDLDYLRREVTVIDYVRDRLAAQVHVLITRQTTGSGGLEYTLTFIGRKSFVGVDDVFRHTTSSTATPDEVRTGYTRLFTMGLMRYLARTPQAARLDVSVAGAEEALQEAAAADPWNYWVFRSGLSGDVTGEELSSSKAVSAFLSATRTTEAWKMRFALNGRYDSRRFELGDGRPVVSVSKNYAGDALVVRSAGPHWGIGFGGSAVTSTFVNQALALRVSPAVEYNVFPYAESTRRQFRFSYGAGVTALDYQEPTIFDRARETRIDQRLQTSLTANQPWGTIDASVEVSQFLDELSQYRAVFLGTAEYRVSRGLSLDVHGGGSFIRDQVYLAKRDASDAEVLLRRRQLATGYDYFLSVGITYTFGSIHDNVVNTRFAGASGRFIRLF